MGGWGVSYPKFFLDFYIFFIFARPLSYVKGLVLRFLLIYFTH